MMKFADKHCTELPKGTPPLGDEYWYPLYEKLCELDVPAHVHSTGNQHGRGTYSTHFIDEESLAVMSLVSCWWIAPARLP